MRAKTLWLAPLLLLPLGAALATPQDKKAAPASAPTDDPMMAKMLEYGTPSAAHEVLAARVGKWTFEMSMYQPDGSSNPPIQGTSECRWIMDGRFLEETINCDFMGMPFHGRGTTGYDNMMRKYVSSWVDNMNTSIFLSEGTFDASSRTFHFSGETPDVMTGKYVQSRWTEKWTDDDHIVSQGFKTGPDGKEYMEMEFHYTRSR